MNPETQMILAAMRKRKAKTRQIAVNANAFALAEDLQAEIDALDEALAELAGKAEAA